MSSVVKFSDRIDVKYGTIIIGAGMSGLAAGIRLAYYDQPVVILERHTTIGGLNSLYRLRGRNYDVGLHAVTNYATKGTKVGPLSKLLRQLRISWDDFDLSPQKGSVVSFPGHDVKFTNDFAFFHSEVEREFPSQKDGFANLVNAINTFDELDLSQEPVSARTVLQRHITDPVLIDLLFCPLMFYGSATPRDMDFSQFVVMFKSIFQQGFGRPYAGVRQILKKLVRKFKEQGGELKLRHGVQQILVKDSKAYGVILDDGTQLEADHVLSSIGVAETLKLCPGYERIPEESPSFRPGDISFCETIYVIKDQPRDLGHDPTIVFYNRAPEFTYDVPTEPCDLRSGIICSPNNFNYGLDEHGNEILLEEGIMRITALANPDYWLNLDPDAYIAAKENWEQRIYNASLGYMPDFRSQILDIDMFTPKTIKRFTGHLNGCVYGSPVKHLQGKTPINNLYLCGTDQGFLGIIGSMLSGITMANNHILSAS